jgi:hypothetical protein
MPSENASKQSHVIGSRYLKEMTMPIDLRAMQGLEKTRSPFRGCGVLVDFR